MTTEAAPTDLVTHRGGCHCGAVQFEIDAPAAIVAQSCNCSMCSMCGFLHLIVPKTRFRLLRGESQLTCYTFNTGVAQHYFCQQCGIKSFYVPRSNPDGYSINVHCLAADSIDSVTTEPFDGRNWEQHADSLRHLTDQ